MTRGLWYGLGAYALWGLFPIYWTLFGGIPALEVLAHRILWSFVALVAVMLAFQRDRARALTATPPRVALQYTVAALLIGVNWFLYVWAVNHGFVIETSLGYFMTPLVNVVLGVVVFRERLSTAQGVAVAIAAGGVLYVTISYGSAPWIALGLASTFGAYGLVKKKAPLAPLEGLTLETATLLAPALIYIGVLQAGADALWLSSGAVTAGLLAGSGIITIGPLLLFAAAVRLVPLSVIGLLQYIAPTIQLVLGVLLFREPFTTAQRVGFACVWAALLIFAGEGMIKAARHRRVARMS